MGLSSLLSYFMVKEMGLEINVTVSVNQLRARVHVFIIILVFSSLLLSVQPHNTIVWFCIQTQC